VYFSGRTTSSADQGLYSVNPDGTGEAPFLLSGSSGATRVQPHFPNVRRTAVTTHAELLNRYAPELRYDSQEGFYADSAATITDYLGNDLSDGDSLIASRDFGASGLPQLELDILGSTYRGGASATESHFLDEDTADQSGYGVAASYMHGQLAYANKTYGRVIGSGDQIWLQYWLWYYYNPFDTLEIGKHEGDWEMIQIGLSPSSYRPLTAVYAQHTGAERCPWDAVETNLVGSGPDVAPVVYPAVGSHASYFTDGVHTRLAGASNDNNDAAGPSIRPSVIDVSGVNEPNWLNWPGHWGSSKATTLVDAPLIGPVKIPGEADSPRGPAFQGAKWTNPSQFAAEADECELEGSEDPGASPEVPDVPVEDLQVEVRDDEVFVRHPWPWSAPLEYHLPRDPEAWRQALEDELDNWVPSFALLSVRRAGADRQPPIMVLSPLSEEGLRESIPLPKGNGPVELRLSLLSQDGERTEVMQKTLSASP
jgi:hypothetical protein